MLSKEEKQKIVERAFEFHTKRAPGLAIGVEMVDLALEQLGPVKDKINAVCEGQSCIIDIIQLMTGCTYGNKYLKVVKDLGRFAFTLYDRFDGRGVRVYIDIDKIDANATPELAKFFVRTRSPEVKAGGPARAESALKIMKEFSGLEESIIVCQPVRVIDHGKPPMYPAARCEKCRESFLVTEDGQKLCCECDGKVKYFETA